MDIRREEASQACDDALVLPRCVKAAVVFRCEIRRKGLTWPQKLALCSPFVRTGQARLRNDLVASVSVLVRVEKHVLTGRVINSPN